ncbi:hypothetical protein SALWKB12_0169 [Snodgrassella communis]|nr:hypothetical protein SALWKB12_0169 [Snodgrassella communis]
MLLQSSDWRDFKDKKLFRRLPEILQGERGTGQVYFCTDT